MNVVFVLWLILSQLYGVLAMLTRYHRIVMPLVLTICVLIGGSFLIQSVEADYNSSNILEYSAESGVVIAEVNDGSGSIFVSGSIFPESGVILTYVPPQDNYELLYWIIKSDVTGVITHTENPLVLNKLDSNTTITPKLRYFSQSNYLSNIYHLDTRFEYKNAFEQWGYFSPETKSGNGMSNWETTSTPLIVDEFIYTYCGDQIYKIQGSSGVVVKQETIEPLSGVYYRYLGYGGGYIIDYNSGTVFDLDLNRVSTIDKSISSSFYHNGFFYGLFPGNDASQTVLKKFAIINDGGTVSIKYVDGFLSDVTKWHGIYGTRSQPVFVGEYLYYIGSTTTTIENSAGQNVVVPYTISLNSININTGSKETIDLGLDYKLVDDGWVTYDGQYLYVTSYVGGLDMGGGDGTNNSPVFDNKMSSVTRIAIRDNGYMEKLFDLEFEEKGITSQFVVYEGRGYVNVNDNRGNLYVYDMSTFSKDSKPIYKNPSVYTHGSIVLNTYNDDSNTEQIQIYMISYELRGFGVCVIEDYAGKTTASSPLYFSDGYDITNYCSQGVRFLPNGNVIFYQDPGCLVSVGPIESNEYYFFISDGSEARWVKSSGADPSDAISISGYASISDDGYTLLQATVDINKMKTGGWNVFVLDQSGKNWIKIPNNYLKNDPNKLNYYGFCHYYQIVKSEDVISYGTEWDMGDHSTYTLWVPLVDQSIIGKGMTFASEEARYRVQTEYIQAHGSVSVSEEEPIVGAVITINITPAHQYSIHSVSYKVGDGEPVVLNPTGGGYNFIMPSSDVIVAVEFIPIYVITYNVGVNAGRDVSVSEIVYKNAVQDYTVYTGYEFEFNIPYPLTTNIFVDIPSWLKPVVSPNNPSIVQKYVGTVEGSDCSFRVESRSGQGPHTYTVNLHIGYYSNSFVKGNVIIGDIPGNITNDEKEFIGWSTEPGSDKVAFRPGSIFELDSNINLYAVWSDEKSLDPSEVHYALSKTFYENEGRTDIDVYINRDIGSKDLSNPRLLVIANYVGGDFVNVYHAPSLNDGAGIERVSVSSQRLISVTIQVVSGIPDGIFCWYGECTYHVGEASKGVLIFESEYGRVPSVEVGSVGTKVVLSSVEVDGYVFEGWSDGKLLYQPGTEFPIAEGKTVLTAKWAAIPTHKVTYDVNGGSDEAPIGADVFEGSTFIIASYHGTIAGMDFIGWNDGSETYSAGSTYVMKTVDVTFTAVWTIKPNYTVSFSSSIGDPGGPVKGFAGGSVDLPAIEDPLYRIVHWTVGDSLVDGSVYTISADDADADGNIVLTAVWERKDLGFREYNLPGSSQNIVPELSECNGGYRFGVIINSTVLGNGLGKNVRLVVEDGDKYTLAKKDSKAINAGDLISYKTLGYLDSGMRNMFVEVTVSKDIVGYRSDVTWTHVRFSFSDVDHIIPCGYFMIAKL